MDQTDPASPLNIRFDDTGLVPAIVQDWRDGTVLMVGFMNREALEHTLRTQYVHFWSRSRNVLWRKGETSGHYLMLKKVFIDCDLDTLLIKAEPVGPTCHTGNPSCFFQEVPDPAHMTACDIKNAHGGILDRLYDMVLERQRNPREGSYVASLLTGGADRILKKVVEEAGEVLLASKNQGRGEIIYEVADLLFHTVILLGHHGIRPEEIYEELGKRFGQSGLRKTEKGTP